MRVGHPNAEGDALVAEFAFGHVAYLLAMRIAYQKASTGIIPAFAAECKSFLKINKKVVNTINSYLLGLAAAAFPALLLVHYLIIGY